MNKLQKIQSELKVPKWQLNKFWNYKYRSCEDILEEVKPMLSSHSMYLIISDEIINLGDRYYIKATATVSDGTECYSATGIAREELEKKWMAESQITGSTSSYARKYALNWLFAIDDTKDADSTNDHKDEKSVGNIQKKNFTEELFEKFKPKKDRFKTAGEAIKTLEETYFMADSAKKLLIELYDEEANYPDFQK